MGTLQLLVGQIITLTIERMAFDSDYGVGRFDGKVIFVPRTSPKEKVRVVLTKVRSTYAVGKLEQILEKGPYRRLPPCPVAGRCGGCDWQHIKYEEQLKQKQGLLSHILTPLNSYGKFTLLPFIGAEEEFRYRNRIQLHREKNQVGFYARGSRQLIPVKDCLLAEKVLVEHFQNIELRAKDTSLPLQERVELARLVDGSILKQFGPPTAETRFFAQVNTRQNDVLKNLISAKIQTSNHDEIIDLYCGSGNITALLLQLWPRASITGVDLSKTLIQQAQKEFKSILFENLKWVVSSTAQYLKEELVEMKKKCSLLVLDPPRVGLDRESCHWIGELSPKEIIYVSCNPMTLVRDLKLILAKGRLRVDSIQGVDMFPQTTHMEIITILKNRV
ncbi:MAG: methyltransferase domain-containing protein [Bdellovibrionales bacterium]|nr:methyltransferase domain-containing protein [Bdellovibrionales bacterium]